MRLVFSTGKKEIPNRIDERSSGLFLQVHTQLCRCTPSPGSRKFSVGGFSPVGLHVLVVDDDPLCLMVLERMLRQCNYNVTTCNRVNLALQLLREKKDEFDLVMSDVYMPDEDGFKLLEVIGLELDLPVIMMSANGETSVVMQGITHGACDYLIKPIRIEELRNIWQHVIRRKGKEMQRESMQGELDEILRGAESQDQCCKKRKEFFEMEDSSSDGINTLKKARVNWSIELHRQFVDAVNQLGIDKAVPKRILDIMNVQGLTRENVASHLQKYRLYLKRLSGVVPEPCPIASFQASGDGLTGGTMLVQLAGKAPLPSTGVKGRNLGAGIGTGVGKDKKIDVGTMESLARYKLHQQKHAANRAQVLGGLGLSDTRSSSEYPAVGLHRMGSLDLKFFLQESSTAQSVDVLDDLAACSFRTVKLEDDVAMASGISVSGVNNKRTYPSRQSAANQGHISRQWSKRAIDACEEQKHKKIGATSGANEPNIAADTAFCESGNFDKVMDNMIAYKVGGGSIIGLNQESDLRGVASGMALRGNQGIQFGSAYNAEILNTSMGLHEAMEGNQQQLLQSVGMYGPARAVAHTPSLVDLADDAVSSTNVEASTSSFTDNSGDAFSESSFSAIAQLGGIMSPAQPPSSSHLLHNNELDISDYLQLDDGFGF